VSSNSTPLFLGIDTGGTFTDSVLFDAATRKIVAKSKAPTTHNRLIDGIVDSIGGLSIRDPRVVGLIGLSTTLATNAVVERKNRPVGLLIVGYEKDLSVPIPGVITRRVAGGHTVRGEEAATLDEKAVRNFIATVDRDVSAYACTSYFSVRNPKHENRVEAIISADTKKPVVLGHRLSMDLDAEVRAVTAALNAGLIPLIAGLLDAVRGALGRLSITAPLMVVRGDGSLMSETTARSRPIETILSGPAASVVGARTLAPLPEGIDTIVIDVGGTTTDIAALSAGSPRLSSRGARVGDYRTFVSAVDMHTTGLGGDSLIDYIDLKSLAVGPVRVLPIGRLGERYPKIVERLAQTEKAAGPPGRYRPTDFFAAWATPPEGAISEEYREVLERVIQSPIRETDSADARERLFLERALDRLASQGAVIRAGLTPTDIFNAAGLCSIGSAAASKAAVGSAARFMGIGAEEFSRTVIDAIGRRLFFLFIASSLGAESKAGFADFGILAEPAAAWLADGKDAQGIRLDFALKRTIIGVGAPVGLFISPIAKRLGADLVVPEDAAVAGAVGAVSGVVLALREAVIRSFDDGTFVLFTPEDRRSFGKLADAKSAAMEELSRLVRQEIETGPSVESRVTGDWEEHWGGGEPNRILIEARLTVRAVGRHAAAT
jgi:N-methylhydantoinase A/oxoprolinase/acetone carboxylase beta subunit